MLRRTGSLAFLALLAAPLAFAQAPAAPPTADEIVAKYVKTIGGMEKIEAVKTLTRTGKFTGGGGFEAKVLEQNERPDLVRQEFTFQGMTGVTAYDGKTRLEDRAVAGQEGPEPLGEDELKGILEDSDFDGPLIHYQEKGNTLEFVGSEPVEGTDAWKLKVTLKNGDVQYYYMDTDYFVPIKIEFKRIVRGAERESEITLGDYKEVAGWYLPHSIEQGRKGSQEQVQDRLREDRSERADGRNDLPPARGAGGGQVRGAMNGRMLVGISAGILGAALAARAAEPVAAPVKVDSETISGLGARNIGSAAMSGRVAAVDAVAARATRLTVYVGAASGGVWKSLNGGTTFKPVFDKQPVQSIGAIAIDPKNPKTVWVGTGEAWTRNCVSIGDGIYKSTDGGETWTNMGLGEIGAHREDPRRPPKTDTVYACVPGKLWSDSDDRGVYRTTDGGKTWTMVLKGGNLSTGCSMISHGPAEPEHALRRHVGLPPQGLDVPLRRRRRRRPERQRPARSRPTAARPGRSSTRRARRASRPSPGAASRSSVAPRSPNVVYAFIEAAIPKNGLYRSDDGGATWEARDRSQNMVWRPFYFASLIVDPKDENSSSSPDRDAHRQRRRRQELQRRSAAARTATSTTSGSIPTTPSTSSPATTAGSGSRTTAATAGGRRRTCRSRSSTT